MLAAVVVALVFGCGDAVLSPEGPGTPDRAVHPVPPVAAQFAGQREALSDLSLGQCLLEWPVRGGVRQVPFRFRTEDLPVSNQSAYLIYRGWETRAHESMTAKVSCRFPLSDAGLDALVERVEKRLSPGISEAGVLSFDLPRLLPSLGLRWAVVRGGCYGEYDGDPVCTIDGIVVDGGDDCGPGATYDSTWGCQCNTGDPAGYPDCGSGGGSGGDSGSSGGGSGGGGSGGTESFDGTSSLPPTEEPVQDTVPIYAPDCPVGPDAFEFEKAWCSGTPVSGTRKDRVQAAIDAMRTLDGPCHTLANRAQALLNANAIRVFSREDANSGGAGFIDGLTILDAWIDRYHSEPFSADGLEVNLQFVIAHETDHSLYGPGHAFVGGTGNWYQETQNARFCSGLGAR